jgi:hypothetical protein
MGLPFTNPLPPPVQAATASWRSKLTPSNIAFGVAVGVMCLMLLTVHHVELRTSHDSHASHASHASHTPSKSAVYTSLCSEHNPNLVGCSPAPSPHSKEAYVSFVSMIADPHYVDAMRLQLFAVRHHPLTRDPTPRDFVVLTTKHTPEWVKAELASEGAVIRYTDIIDGMPGEDTVGGRLNYRDMYTKLAIWNLTDYDRVLYLDADILISKPMYEIWDDPNSDPPSGLAGLSDPMGQDHEIPIPDNGYINAGLLLLRPSNVTFKRLVETRDFDYGLFEQVRGAHYRNRASGHYVLYRVVARS